MKNRKTIRQELSRKIKQEKIRQALEKKPTNIFINSTGISKKELIKKTISPGENMRRGTRNRSVIKKSDNFRPVFSPQSYSKKAVAEFHKDYATPEWFSSDRDVDISIIVPCFKSHEVIKDQIASWDLQCPLNYEIIYIDDNCPFASHKYIIDAWALRKNEIKNPIGKIKINSKNCGYAYSCNLGASHAKGKYLVFLNADTTVTPGWLEALMEPILQNENVGIVGNLHLKGKNNLINSCGSEWDWKTGSFQHIGFTIHNRNKLSKPYTLESLPEDLKQIREVEMTTGACFVMTSKLFKEIEGFDLDYKIGYWEDADLCMKVRANGYKILNTPKSIISHVVGHSHVSGHPFFMENRNIFFRKWVDTKILEMLLIDSNNFKRSINPPKKESIVIYTAISNGYDHLKEQKKKEGIEFIAFTNESFTSETWKHKQIHNEFSDSNRNAKIHKILSHKFFPDKEYSLWIDGSVTIEFDIGMERLIELYLSDTDIALFKHSNRNCIYQEASVCIQQRLDDINVIKRQIEKYTQEGFPANLGLCECPILLRRHTPKIIEFNEAWWDEIQRGSKRDQLSFNYVANKLNLKYKLFPGNLRKRNYLFHRGPHKSKKR